MARPYLSRRAREAMPASDFGDPARRMYPIVDQADVDQYAAMRLPAHVQRAIAAIATRKGLVPQRWTENDQQPIAVRGPGLVDGLTNNSPNGTRPMSSQYDDRKQIATNGDRAGRLDRDRPVLDQHGNPPPSADPARKAWEDYQAAVRRVTGQS